jgi:uncharacterized membrane protein
MKTDAPSGAENPFYLPDFCTSLAALVIVLIVELTAIVLALARQSIAVDFWTDLARTSLFLLWIGLAGAGLLCWVGGRLARLSVAQGSAVALALITGVIAAVSECAVFIGHTELVANAGAEGATSRSASSSRRSHCATSLSPTNGAATSRCEPRPA